MRVAPQSSHCSTWPPSAAVRQAVMALMMRRSTHPRCPACACRNAAPWRRKISATYLTREDEQNFGPELLDVAQRAAAQVVAPHLQNLQQRTMNCTGGSRRRQKGIL